MSARASMSAAPSTCSGAMYAGVPTMPPIVFATPTAPAAAWAMPKSVTTMRPSLPTRTLSGLRSRWTTLAAWAAAHARADLDDDLRRPRASGSRPRRADEARERLAVDELHREELLPLVLADVERAGHVAVRDAARELRLLPEAREDPGRVDQLAAEHLERDDLVELRVARPVHRTHPARAEEAQDLVATREHLRPGPEDREARRGRLRRARRRERLAHAHLDREAVGPLASGHSTISPGQTACRLPRVDVIMKACAPPKSDSRVTVIVRWSLSPLTPDVRSHENARLSARP